MSLEKLVKFERVCLACHNYPEKYHEVPNEKFRQVLKKTADEFVESVGEATKYPARRYTKAMASIAMLELRRHRKGKKFQKLANKISAEALTLRQEIKENENYGDTG